MVISFTMWNTHTANMGIRVRAWQHISYVVSVSLNDNEYHSQWGTLTNNHTVIMGIRSRAWRLCACVVGRGVVGTEGYEAMRWCARDGLGAGRASYQQIIDRPHPHHANQANAPRTHQNALYATIAIRWGLPLTHVLISSVLYSIRLAGLVSERSNIFHNVKR